MQLADLEIRAAYWADIGTGKRFPLTALGSKLHGGSGPVREIHNEAMDSQPITGGMSSS